MLTPRVHRSVALTTLVRLVEEEDPYAMYMLRVLALNRVLSETSAVRTSVV